MAKLTVFNGVSLDGYFSGANGDVSWAYSEDAEWQGFVEENARGGGLLLLGRITYELMAGYWPTPPAIKAYPLVAERMNSLPKVVFSRTLEEAAWNNTIVVKGDPAAEVRKRKKEPGMDMVILGSGSVVSRLAQAGLIDEYQFAVYPVVLGQGRTMFEGVKERLALRRTRMRSFGNGNVLLCYEPRQG
jgi:dihydrofolate reductase